MKIIVLLSATILFLCIEGCSIQRQDISSIISQMDEVEVSGSDSLIVISDGKILLSIDEGESGDYINKHLQYYKNNKLKYYKRISRFFNSLCYDGVLTESEEYDVRGNDIILKKRTIIDENGNNIDTTDCQFPYRGTFRLTYTLDD